MSSSRTCANTSSSAASLRCPATWTRSAASCAPAPTSRRFPSRTTSRKPSATLYGVARTIAVPAGAVDTSGSEAEDAWNTLWFSLADLTHKVFYFQSTSSPNSYWVEFRKLNLAPGSPIRAIDAYDPKLSGEISAALTSK